MTDTLVQNAIVKRLEDMERRNEEITAAMSQPEVLSDRQQLQKLGREQRVLQAPASIYGQLKGVLKELADLQALLKDGSDPDLRELAREDAERLTIERQRLLDEATELLRPRDPNDERDVIIEIRAAEGGAEAGLWAADLMRMYLKYAELRRWKTEILNTSETEIGGIREVSFEVKGDGAYSRLKYESGVHRVQRVPVTEASGRVHTSTATVAVMPEPDEVEVDVRDDDLRIEVYRSSGHGGQSVNTTDSAVRITHLPTGEVVTCQDERSQLKNKTRALAVLRARLYERELASHQEAISGLRRSQVGRGERAEKIRTYNFKENRIRDHRVDLTVYNLANVLEGQLDPLIDPLAAADRSQIESA